jgi:hypothetical protein
LRRKSVNSHYPAGRRFHRLPAVPSQITRPEDGLARRLPTVHARPTFKHSFPSADGFRAQLRNRRLRIREAGYEIDESGAVVRPDCHTASLTVANSVYCLRVRLRLASLLSIFRYLSTIHEATTLRKTKNEVFGSGVSTSNFRPKSVASPEKDV